MALEIQPVLLRHFDDIHHPVSALDHIDEIHHLRQADDPGKLSQFFDLRHAKLCPGVLKARDCRHAAWNIDELPHGQFLRTVVHIAHAFHTPHISNLMGIGDNGGGPVGDHGAGEIPGRHHRAFNMLMGVDKSREQVLALPVDHLRGLVKIRLQVLILHMSDHPVVDKNIGRIDLSCDGVDQLHILDQQIAWDLSQGSFQKLPLVLWTNFHNAQSPLFIN